MKVGRHDGGEVLLSGASRESRSPPCERATAIGDLIIAFPVRDGCIIVLMDVRKGGRGGEDRK